MSYWVVPFDCLMHAVRIILIKIQAHAISYATHHNCNNRIFKSVAKRTGSLSLLDKFISLRRSFATVNALSIISIFLWTDGTDSLDSSSTRVCGFIKVLTVRRRTVFSDVWLRKKVDCISMISFPTVWYFSLNLHLGVFQATPFRYAVLPFLRSGTDFPIKSSNFWYWNIAAWWQ